MFEVSTDFSLNINIPETIIIITDSSIVEAYTTDEHFIKDFRKLVKDHPNNSIIEELEIEGAYKCLFPKNLISIRNPKKSNKVSKRSLKNH